MYFSEREDGEIPREKKEISDFVWEGIKALIQARVNDGSFGASYPVPCEDVGAIIGTDADAFWRALKADIPKLQDWWQAEKPSRTLDILDMIEFCWRCIGKPSQRGYHKFFSHHHLDFDTEAGQDEFRDDINRIFRRNGLAYELTEEGGIERLVPPVLREELESAQFYTGDAELDRMLDVAKRKFFDLDEEIRREALKFLWDAWERLKTLGEESDKKAQITSLLDRTAGSSSPKFREALERDAHELTKIGNTFQIRHSERNQEQLVRSEHVDYLFHRLFALIHMILRLMP